jgi:hypothetical protein
MRPKVVVKIRVLREALSMAALYAFRRRCLVR